MIRVHAYDTRMIRVSYVKIYASGTVITARKIKEDINYERKIIPSRQCLLVQVMLIWDDDNGIEDFDIHLLAQDICTP